MAGDAGAPRLSRCLIADEEGSGTTGSALEASGFNAATEGFFSTGSAFGTPALTAETAGIVTTGAGFGDATAPSDDARGLSAAAGLDTVEEPLEAEGADDMSLESLMAEMDGVIDIERATAFMLTLGARAGRMKFFSTPI